RFNAAKWTPLRRPDDPASSLSFRLRASSQIDLEATPPPSLAAKAHEYAAAVSEAGQKIVTSRRYSPVARVLYVVASMTYTPVSVAVYVMRESEVSGSASSLVDTGKPVDGEASSRYVSRPSPSMITVS